MSRSLDISGMLEAILRLLELISQLCLLFLLASGLSVSLDSIVSLLLYAVSFFLCNPFRTIINDPQHKEIGREWQAAK